MISHFIPSVQLTGSRDDKLRKLDRLIQHLQQVRGALSGDGPASCSIPDTYGRALRPCLWFIVGIVTGAVFALFAQAATRWLL